MIRLRRLAAASLLALALTLGLAAAPAFADDQPPPGEPVVAAIRLNGQAQGDAVVTRQGADGWLVPREDLARWGLAVSAPERLLDGRPHVLLGNGAGLALDFEARTMTLAITAEPRLLGRTDLSLAPAAMREPLGSSARSAFVNWAVEHETGFGADTRFSGEAGWRDGNLLLVGQGQTLQRPGGGSTFVRLGTTGTLDRPAQGLRWTAGDLFTQGHTLTPGLQLGGIAVSRVTDHDPYQIRYPLGAIRGQAALPSDVEIFVDGQRVRSERVRPGEFALNDLPTPQGAGAVQVVVRDPYGREQRFDYTLYTSDQLLRSGLHEFHYAAGGLRQGYGERSADYGPPALTAHHRWGWTDAITLGWRAAARAGVSNGGPGLTLRLGAAGVVSASAAFSRAGAIDGLAGALRYDYQSRRWGAGAALRRDGRGYAAVGEDLTVSGLAQESYLYASGRVGDWGHLWFARSQSRARPLPEVPVPPGFRATATADRRSATLGVVHSLPRGVGSLRLGISRTTDTQGPRTELTVNAVFALDPRSLLATGSRAGGGRQVHTVQWNRSPPPGEGWGHDLSAAYDSASGGALDWRAAAQLNAPWARLRGEYEGRRAGPADADHLRLAASGGLAWLDGRWHAGRPIEGGFAVVKVGQIAGVPVRVNGVPSGITDERGELFIPQLGSWYDNQIGIDASRLPLDVSVARLQQRVALADRGGAVIDFEARPIRAWTARLWRPAAAGAAPLVRAAVRLQLPRGVLQAATGLQGELYLENLPPGRHDGEADDGQIRCRFQLEVPADGEVLHEAGDLRCEPA